LELRQAVGAPDEFPLVAGMGPRLIALKVEKGPAMKAGMKDGDIITRIGDRSAPSQKDLYDIVGANAGNTLSFDVLRDGQPVTLQVQVERTKTGGKIQVAPAQDLEHADVSVRDPDAAPRLDMLQHDRQARIAAVDGTPVKSWEDIYSLLRKKTAGEKVALTFASAAGPATASAGADASAAATAPAEQTASITVSPELATALAQRTHYIADIPVEVETRTQRADTAWGAMVMGGQHTWKFIEQVYMTLLGLVRGTVDPSNLHGIVGITKVGYDIQQRGPVWLWYLLAMVSVNLAVANFLPLPIVDGGLFLLLILEKIRGRPLSLKVQSAIQIVGIVLLAGLFIFVTYNDIWLVFTGK
jgi:regulator of sigma E protease